MLQQLEDLLAHPRGGQIEILAALSGRAWEALGHAPLLNAYLRRLATGDAEHGGFAACVSDLLSLPDLTDRVRKALRDPGQHEDVRAAFGKMLAPR